MRHAIYVGMLAIWHHSVGSLQKYQFIKRPHWCYLSMLRNMQSSYDSKYAALALHTAVAFALRGFAMVRNVTLWKEFSELSS